MPEILDQTLLPPLHDTLLWHARRDILWQTFLTLILVDSWFLGLEAELALLASRSIGLRNAEPYAAASHCRTRAQTVQRFNRIGGYSQDIEWKLRVCEKWLLRFCTGRLKVLLNTTTGCLKVVLQECKPEGSPLQPQVQTRGFP